MRPLTSVRWPSMEKVSYEINLSSRLDYRYSAQFTCKLHLHLQIARMVMVIFMNTVTFGDFLFTNVLLLDRYGDWFA